MSNKQKSRRYKHFDIPVKAGFAEKATATDFVSRHSWSPLISYIKRTKRYKPVNGKTVFKERPIMYASHRDAAIFSEYADKLTERLDRRYAEAGLNDSVIAYRSLGRSNYHFSAEAMRFAVASAPCVVLCFDVSGFFDNLDHQILKANLRQVLGGPLDNGWYAVFKAVTQYRHVSRDDLDAHPEFGPRLRSRAAIPVATISEIREAGVSIKQNKESRGIPQGTPISAALSNLYMIGLDARLDQLCAELGGLYRRYSDDILIICPEAAADRLANELSGELGTLKLEVHPDKVERTAFALNGPAAFQYLGFIVPPTGALIRPSSLSRQWRKAKRSLKRTKRAADAAIESGTATKAYTKKLRRRFPGRLAELLLLRPTLGAGLRVEEDNPPSCAS